MRFEIIYLPWRGLLCKCEFTSQLHACATPSWPHTKSAVQIETPGYAYWIVFARNALWDPLFAMVGAPIWMLVHITSPCVCANESSSFLTMSGLPSFIKYVKMTQRCFSGYRLNSRHQEWIFRVCSLHQDLYDHNNPNEILVLGDSEA